MYVLYIHYISKVYILRVPAFVPGITSHDTGGSQQSHDPTVEFALGILLL